MKAALLIVLSLAALAAAGPASFNNRNNKNDIDTFNKVQQQQQQYVAGDLKQTQAVEILKQWCFSSQLSQPELTSSFKKLVGLVKSSPVDEATEAAVMSERICQGAIVQKSPASGETIANNGVDAQAHELIKDVYMDAMIACESRECMQQLLKIIQSQKVDTIRASYYMTRMAVAEKDTIKDERDIKQWAETLIKNTNYEQTSEAIERQKLFATTSIVGKFMKNKCDRRDQVVGDLKQTVEQVAKTIIERYIRPVSQQEIQQYQQQQPQQLNKELVKKIAKRNAALKALANIPGCVLSEIKEVEQVCVELALKKEELVTVRQTAIECLQHNDNVYRQLKQITFDQEEPIEVRVAALRTLMTVVWAGKEQQQQQKQQMATEIVDQLVKHCEEQRNQQQDDQFCLYAISYLDNLRTSQKPEHEAIRESISKNKQHYMQIQLLTKKFKQQLNDIRRSSRNYKLEQEFNQIESGLVLEGDIVYESKQHRQQQNQPSILPKLVRVNMSMPIMGETVNVVEVTLRQNQMDEELLETLKMVKDVKFNSETVSKVVDSFKSTVESQQRRYNQRQAEADLTIKVDGCTVVYICAEDFKYTTEKNYRSTRSIHGGYSIIDELIEQLKRNPINFNRGFNVNFNQRLAKALDVDANLIAGLRFNSRATGQTGKDFEIVAQVEPRVAFEAIVGPAKMTSKKLLQRISTKTAFGLRLRYKNDELVDIQVDLPLNTMELFTFETQMVEKNPTIQNYPYAYTYLPDSIYGQEDIYLPEEEFLNRYGDNEETSFRGLRKTKRSIFGNDNKKSSIAKFISGGKQRKVAYEMETSEKVARLTGLRGKLRVVASPKDMSFLVQAVCQKYEPQMQGYRFKFEKINRGVEQQQLLVTVSTPGSRFDRTMQFRSIVQYTPQRTMIKTDIQSPILTTRMQLELLHDGRQFAVKAECVEGINNKHLFECGVQRNSQSGRIAATYKPYLNIQSTYLRRPIQMQGVVSFQQQPKTVISWEMKCPISGDFVQGKFIVDQKSINDYQMNQQHKRTGFYNRRSMRSPIELIEMIFERGLTVTGELVGQVQQHAIKVHQMVDLDTQKYTINADLSVSHKNMVKSNYENNFLCQLKLNKEQQVVLVQHKCPQQPHKEYRINIVSDYKIPQQHQLVAEYRYNTRRQSDLNSMVVYKHKVDVNELSSRKVQVQYQIELLANQFDLNEKIQGRTEVHFERRFKSFRTEMTSRDKLAKVVVDFESIEKHNIELIFESKEYQLSHKTVVRADERQFQCQSRTDKRGQMLAKLVVELAKYQNDCQIVLEVPYKQVRCVVDLKLNSGKPSSWAIQTPRFASKAEFTFDIIANNKRINNFWRQPFRSMLPLQSLKFKTDLKDLIKQDSYWMDTKFDTMNPMEKSYFRLDSPIYRTDIEYDPRDWSSKIGMFARSKRSILGQNQLYSNEDSILNQIIDITHLKSNKNLNLGDKLWMVRSMISPSSTVEGLKQQIKRAIFEYADRRQQHKHQINWSPMEERLNFNFEHLPTEDMERYSRFTGDLNTKYFNDWYNNKETSQVVYPMSKLSMENEFVDFDFDFKPFDGEESYTKLSALSRLPRSTGFKKHESEYKYNKHGGYKAHVKHLDDKEHRHQWELESDESPKKYAKLSMESDKFGKAHYEHNWRKYVNKHPKKDQLEKEDYFRFQEEDKYDQKRRYNEEEDVFANRVKFFAESPRDKFSHQTDFMWEEPMKLLTREGRFRRDLVDQQIVASDYQRRYNTLDYLKHINARLSSQTSQNKRDLYKLDFDYKPREQQLARLNVNLPNELLHESTFEYKPVERLYKLQSKLMDQANKQVHYDLMAQTKPVGIVSGLATAEQEPVFFNDQHPMLERPIYKERSLLKEIFKQPLKLDYTDKFGRVARVDYDLVPEQQSFQSYTPEEKYFGLRQKRAAIYYKDDSQDFEHESTFDFYPEPLLSGGFKQQHLMKHQMESRHGDYITKVSTKYGPIVIRLDSNTKSLECQIETPVLSAKLTGETSSPMKRSTGVKLYKIQLDNKQQRVQLAKIVRKTPILGEMEPIVRLAHKLDQSRFEHQTELLVSLVDAIFKIKSQTHNNQRPVMTIEGEFNKQQEKLMVKIDGVRTSGQLVCDLVTGTSQLVLDVDDKRTIQHKTRLVRLNEKFFSLESVTTYKQQPLFKLNGKISAMVFSEPMHIFSAINTGRQSHMNISNDDHISTFEGTIFQPKMYHIRGQYDLIKKEAKLVLKNEDKVQLTTVKYDAPNMTIHLDAVLQSTYGQIYKCESKLAIPGIFYPRHCRNQQSCQSEIVYTSNNNQYSANYYPGDYALIQGPFGKQYINLGY